MQIRRAWTSIHFHRVNPTLSHKFSLSLSQNLLSFVESSSFELNYLGGSENCRRQEEETNGTKKSERRANISIKAREASPSNISFRSVPRLWWSRINGKIRGRKILLQPDLVWVSNRVHAHGRVVTYTLYTHTYVQRVTCNAPIHLAEWLDSSRGEPS